MKDRYWIEALEDDAWNGTVRLRVRGCSMHPTLQMGDEVLVETVQYEDLHPGDWVVLKATSGLIIHRFLGLARNGKLFTKGDGHRAPDPLWNPDVLLGRAVALSRDGEMIPIRSDTARERIRTFWHRGIAALWTLLRRGSWLALLITLLLPMMILAAVTLVSFEAEVQSNNTVLVTWETASEVNMLGFFVQRSTEEFGTYERISDIVPAVGEVAGALYDFTDTETVAGTTYYYKLEALETDGNAEFHGPVSVQTSGDPPTQEPTDEPETPTDTPTATSTPEPDAPTPIPTVYARFWADATSLDAGQCTTLRWQTDHAARVELNGEGVPGGYSEEQVCPCADQTYVLRAFGHDGSYEEDTIALNVSGACTPVPPGSSPTPTRTPRPTQTPRPTSRPTRVPDRATATPRPTQTPRTTQMTPSPTASSEKQTTSPLTTPDPENPVLSSPLSPSPTSVAGQQIPTRTPPTTGNRNDLQGVDARSGGLPVWLIIALIAGTALIGAGGWGIWRAWKEKSGS